MQTRLPQDPACQPEPKKATTDDQVKKSVDGKVRKSVHVVRAEDRFEIENMIQNALYLVRSQLGATS